jgi:hypothetical protein
VRFVKQNLHQPTIRKLETLIAHEKSVKSSERNLFLEGIRRNTTEDFAGVVVNPVFNSGNAHHLNLSKIRALGVEAADETIGVFVCTALEAAVGVGVVHLKPRIFVY